MTDAVPIRLDMKTGNRTHPVSERADDLYETPAVATLALLKVEPVPFCIWEPACGKGAIVRVLRESGRTVIAHNLIDHGCPESEARRDFLMERECPPGVPAIVTNPPFALAEEFVGHAIELVPEVYMLLRVAFLEGLRWEKKGFRHHLARTWVFAPRLPMMHREGWDGPKNSNSGMAFCWMVFRRNWSKHGGTPTIDWINWKKMDLGT